MQPHRFLFISALALSHLSNAVASVSARVWPTTLVARDTSDVLFCIRAIDEAIPAGAEVQIQIPYTDPGPLGSHVWDAAQTDDPDALGYVWVETPIGVEAEAIAEGWFLGASLSSGTIQAGDSLVVHYRGTIQSAALDSGTTRTLEVAPFRCLHSRSF